VQVRCRRVDLGVGEPEIGQKIRQPLPLVVKVHRPERLAVIVDGGEDADLSVCEHTADGSRVPGTSRRLLAPPGLPLGADRERNAFRTRTGRRAGFGSHRGHNLHDHGRYEPIHAVTLHAL